LSKAYLNPCGHIFLVLITSKVAITSELDQPSPAVPLLVVRQILVRPPATAALVAKFGPIPDHHLYLRLATARFSSQDTPLAFLVSLRPRPLWEQVLRTLILADPRRNTLQLCRHWHLVRHLMECTSILVRLPGKALPCTTTALPQHRLGHFLLTYQLVRTTWNQTSCSTQTEKVRHLLLLSSNGMFSLVLILCQIIMILIWGRCPTKKLSSSIGLILRHLTLIPTLWDSTPLEPGADAEQPLFQPLTNLPRRL